LNFGHQLLLISKCCDAHKKWKQHEQR
jgi:hypothetical protein